MPPQRNRGSYAKYICLNCRSRKIKCALPDGVEILLGGQAQPVELACQRCRIKGLECVVDHTTLGRPSEHHGHTNRAKMRISPQAKNGPSVASSSAQNLQTDAAFGDEQDRQESESVEHFLIVRPRQADSQPENSSTKLKGDRPAPLDKFLALVDPKYLLSTLLLRDQQFGTSLSTAWMSAATSSLGVLTDGVVAELDYCLIWHRLYFPDIPNLSDLQAQLSTMSSYEIDFVPRVLLLVLLSSIALEIQMRTNIAANRRLKNDLDALVFRYGQQLLSTLPWHRYSILSLELMAEYKPMMLATERTTAAYAIRAKMIPPLVKEIAIGLALHTAPLRLMSQLTETGSAEDGLLTDCLQWYRLCLADTSNALSGEGREQEARKMHGRSTAEAVSVLQQLMRSKQVPLQMQCAVHSLLCSARRFEALLAIKSNWKDLSFLGNSIVAHQGDCEEQRVELKKTVQSASGWSSEFAAVTYQLIDLELHNSYCWVSGSAIFFCIMAGAEAARNPSQLQASNGLDAEQALQISDQIIDRLADRPRAQQMIDSHTRFLIKFGEQRMDDLELVLVNFIAAADNLKLSGIAFTPPARSTTCGILHTCKDIMEGNAARMKGWGGLHDRAYMQLLLMRDCAASLERIGGRTDRSNIEAVKQGCLWASTSRLIKSLHHMLAEWKEWSTLGKAVPYRDAPGSSAAKRSADHGPGLDSAFGDVDMLDDLVSNDLFFDWNLWLQEDPAWNFV